MAKMVRAVVSQETDDEQRESATWDECKGAIAVLQDDVQGFLDVQAKMGHEITSLVTGLQN